ncbi:MAG: hypothetical protein SD837_17000 [Candidatus Electrothrix scaldis]|nr:MAG: hypothetical protein SD837_17000 [Candidatus Electrothrix sp. GW3-3]
MNAPTCLSEVCIPYYSSLQDITSAATFSSRSRKILQSPISGRERLHPVGHSGLITALINDSIQQRWWKIPANRSSPLINRAT